MNRVISMNVPITSLPRNGSAFPLAAAMLTGALLLTGCLTPAERESDTGLAKAPPALSHEEGFKLLESMGYPRERIEATGTGFVLEGDMVFSFEALNRVKGSPLAKTAQRASSAVQNPKPNLLKVAMHSSMTDWAKFVHQAVNNWNAPNTRLHLEVVPITNSPNITIYSDASPSCPDGKRNLPSSTGGMADMAFGGFPGAAICINKDNPNMQMPFFRVMTITHELGHTIGFHHTDTDEGSLIPGTPASDFPSIMNSGGNSFGGLSFDDLNALEILYSSDKPLGGTDLDGDRKDDIVYWRPSNGLWNYLRSSTGFAFSGSQGFGVRGDWPMADMDIDGDGLDDRVVWHSKLWRMVPSRSGALREIPHGSNGDIPIGNHDMDGDGKDDLVIWRWRDSTFKVLTSRSDFTAPLSFKWGDIGDIPVGGIDADRDGKDDFVVWRANMRLYWVRYSASNFTTSAAFAGGQAGDIPVGGNDLDRDNKDDLTTWRPGDGNWTARTSANDFASTVTFQWGGRGDVPLTGTDIDQDGKRDIGLWRPSIGTWYFRLSGTGFATSRSFVWGQ